MILRKIIIIYFFLFSSLQTSEVNPELIEIYKNLRCLICQGQSVADSNSDFASTIKLVVKDQVEEGKTKKEIYNFLISIMLNSKEIMAFIVARERPKILKVTSLQLTVLVFNSFKMSFVVKLLS